MRAFSAMSVAKGMRPAFLEYLADDGVLFRPRPINGKQLWSGRANPEETLVWEPSYAEVSGAGDLGLTFGPWEYRPAKGKRGEVGHGQFISVWTRGVDEPWRLLVDIGISHDAPKSGGLAHVKLTEGPRHPAPRRQPRRRSG